LKLFLLFEMYNFLYFTFNKKIQIISKFNSSKSLHCEATVDYAFDCKSGGKNIFKGLFSPGHSRNIDLITDRMIGEKNEKKNTVRENQGKRGNCMPQAEPKAREKCARRGYTIRIYVFVIVNRLSVFYLYLRFCRNTLFVFNPRDRKILKRSGIRVNSTPEQSTFRNAHSNNACGTNSHIVLN